MEYAPAAWERAMRIQDVILRAISGEISWFAAADILQMTPRNLRRWRERYERWGYNGLVDQRRCPSKRRVPMAELERVLRLYRERYAGLQWTALPRDRAARAWRHAVLQLCEAGACSRRGCCRRGRRAGGIAAPRAAGVFRRVAPSGWQPTSVARPGAGRAGDAHHHRR